MLEFENFNEFKEYLREHSKDLGLVPVKLTEEIVELNKISEISRFLYDPETSLSYEYVQADSWPLLDDFKIKVGNPEQYPDFVFNGIGNGFNMSVLKKLYGKFVVADRGPRVFSGFAITAHCGILTGVGIYVNPFGELAIIIELQKNVNLSNIKKTLTIYPDRNLDSLFDIEKEIFNVLPYNDSIKDEFRPYIVKNHFHQSPVRAKIFIDA